MNIRSGVLALVFAWLTGCGSAETSSAYFIKIKGSDTVLPVAQKFAESYDKAESSTEISVTGGGSGVGIAALLENTTDIAMSSRDIKMSEKIRLKNKELPFVKNIIAYDALAVCVHKSNAVSKLTREQLEGIYTGHITNWKELGGADQEIVVYSRESSSGTHEFFKERVLNRKEFAPGVLMMSATGAIIQSVSQTPGAVGYVGLAYVNSEVKALEVSYDSGKHYITPSIANAQNKSYPIVRPLFFLYLQREAKRLQDFIHFVLSDPGQQMVLELGFVPLDKETSAQQLKGLPTSTSIQTR